MSLKYESLIEIAQMVKEYAKNEQLLTSEGSEAPTKDPVFYIYDIINSGKGKLKSDDDDDTTPTDEEDRRLALRLYAVLCELFPLHFRPSADGRVQVLTNEKLFPREIHELMFNQKLNKMKSIQEWEKSEANAILDLTRLHFEELKANEPPKDEQQAKAEEELAWYEEEREMAGKEFSRMATRGEGTLPDKEELIKRYAKLEEAVFE